MPFTVAIMASAIPLAIRLYSIAVAPDSSARNWRNFANMPGKVGYSSKALVKIDPVNLGCATRQPPSTMTPCSFPPPWTIEEHNQACFIVKDAGGQALAYFYFEDEPGRRSAANLPTRDGAKEVRRSVPLRTAN